MSSTFYVYDAYCSPKCLIVRKETFLYFLKRIYLCYEGFFFQLGQRLFRNSVIINRPEFCRLRSVCMHN